MSHADSSRQLRIEQLELRSMLTANLLSLITGNSEFSGDATNDIQRNSHQASDGHGRGSVDRSAQVRNVGGDSSGRPGDALGGQGQPTPRPSGRTDGFGGHGPQPRVPEQNSTPIGNLSEQQQPVIVLRVILIDPPANQSIHQQPSSSESVKRIAAAANEPSSSRIESKGSTSRATGLASASMDAESSIEQRKFLANEAPVTMISADNDIRSWAEQTNDTVTQPSEPRPLSNSILDRDSDDGFIDPFPRASDQSMNDSPGQSQPWQIDLGTLRALHQASNLLRDNASDVTDIAVADCFNDQAGLIDFGQSNIPFAIPMIPDALVDVQLNASVGLHRSIELIAAETDRPAADNIRDAMMAALVAVENQAPTGVTEPMPIRSTETAYASVAMVLGTVALVAQRKRLSKKSGETAGAGPGDRDMD
jgi:hypothetical protein